MFFLYLKTRQKDLTNQEWRKKTKAWFFGWMKRWQTPGGGIWVSKFSWGLWHVEVTSKWFRTRSGAKLHSLFKSNRFSCLRISQKRRVWCIQDWKISSAKMRHGFFRNVNAAFLVFRFILFRIRNLICWGFYAFPHSRICVTCCRLIPVPMSSTSWQVCSLENQPGGIWGRML